MHESLTSSNVNASESDSEDEHLLHTPEPIPVPVKMNNATKLPAPFNAVAESPMISPRRELSHTHRGSAMSSMSNATLKNQDVSVVQEKRYEKLVVNPATLRDGIKPKFTREKVFRAKFRGENIEEKDMFSNLPTYTPLGRVVIRPTNAPLIQKLDRYKRNL